MSHHPAVTVRPMGERALLLELGPDSDPLAVAAAIQRLRDEQVPPWHQVTDVVPASATVLLYADRPTRPKAWQQAIPALLDVAPTRSEHPDEVLLEIPVRYDGEDLQEVARSTGRTVAEVVADHGATLWTVVFGGFLPGFGYLRADAPTPQVPRRSLPRTRVPAGSVGLAGEYSGVYPRPSPGGWQLIGRTPLDLFDVDREPPALLVPGRRVRFVAER